MQPPFNREAALFEDLKPAKNGTCASGRFYFLNQLWLFSAVEKQTAQHLPPLYFYRMKFILTV
ncbi:hypothetical protein HNQ04_003132 [Deinococcus radiopugnans ATCC 19172]|uniref:Transposase n=1 Tax=Deinococcus radiopugnans ATCC 19172 TaxID=585398 RepID=A0ABR6NY80_9DEIO|nr:hypothetical protein [Deinococcus radiopugnans ATCC 19172]